MFGKIIYYDKKTIDDYKSVIKGQRNLAIEEYDITNDKGISADLKIVGADAKATKSYKARVKESDLYDCDEFEKLLSMRDDYFDFTTRAECDISTVPNKSIIKIDGQIEIPEEFDLMTIIDQFKPWLLQSSELQQMEETGRMALETILGTAKATKIPIIVDAEDTLLCGKVLQASLITEYEEFTDLEDEQVTIIARVLTGTVSKDKPFYDPLKDFMSLNRMLRKSIKDRGKELSPIKVDDDYRIIEILAIYR